MKKIVVYYPPKDVNQSNFLLGYKGCSFIEKESFEDWKKKNLASMLKWLKSQNVQIK